MALETFFNDIFDDDDKKCFIMQKKINSRKYQIRSQISNNQLRDNLKKK